MSVRRGCFLIAAVFFLLVWGTTLGSGTGIARAEVIPVTPANVEGNIAADDTATKNLQEIIDDGGTKSGDVIQFAAGTYTDVGELLVTKPLTFRKDPGASGDAVITGKFMLHIRSKDVKVEDLTFRNVIFPDRVTVEKNPSDPLTVGEEFGVWFRDRDFSIDKFLLGRKAANSDDDATNDDRFTGADGLDYSGYEGGLARKDLAPFLQDGPDVTHPSGCWPAGGEYPTGNLNWYQYNPTALVTDEDGAPINFDSGALVNQWWNRTPPRTDYNSASYDSDTDRCGWNALGNNPKWRFFNFRQIHPMRWLKDQYGVIMISSRYRHGRTTCPKGGEMTGIEISRNEFDGTEVSAVLVNLHLEWKSVCEEEVSIVGNVFNNVGVVDSEYLRDGEGNFITDGEGYRVREPRGSKYAVSLRDVKTALVSDNVIRATTAYQIFVQGAPEGARIMIRNNLLEAATTPGSRLLGSQIKVDTWDPETDPQADDVEVTIMNNRIIGTTVPYSTYSYRDFKRLLWEEERLCDLYPTLHTMPLARVEQLIEPRIWRSYVPDFPYPDEDGSSAGVRIPMPPDRPPVPLVDLIKKKADGGVEPLTDDVVIGGWDIVRFRDCSRSARISVEHQRNVRIVGNDLGYVASSAAGTGRSRSVVADGHGEDSEEPGYLRFGVSLRGEGAKLREFRGNNIDYAGVRAVDVYDTEETVSAAGNFLGVGGRVSESVSREGTLGVPIVRAAGEAVGPRPEMQAPPMKPTVEGASVDGAVLTLTFSEELDGSSVPVGTAFDVRGEKSGGRTPVYTVDSVRVSGVEVRLTLTPPVAPGTMGVTVSYAKPASGDVLSAADGDEVDSFPARAVTVEGEPVPPSDPGAAGGGGGDGGCSLASAGGAGIVSAAFMLLSPLLFLLRRSGE